MMLALIATRHTDRRNAERIARTFVDLDGTIAAVILACAGVPPVGSCGLAGATMTSREGGF
jgi:hypothetical protein